MEPKEIVAEIARIIETTEDNVPGETGYVTISRKIVEFLYNIGAEFDHKEEWEPVLPNYAGCGEDCQCGNLDKTPAFALRFPDLTILH